LLRNKNKLKKILTIDNNKVVQQTESWVGQIVVVF